MDINSSSNISINTHQYTSRFSVTMLIGTIDTWSERKLLTSLKPSPYFTVMADECQDISSQEELSICFRWLVNSGALLDDFACKVYRCQSNYSLHGEKNPSITTSLSVKDMMGHQLFQGATPGFKEKCMFMHLILSTSTVPGTEAAESVDTIKKMFGTMEVFGSCSITFLKKLSL